jgi:hypothetical protein
MNTSDFYNEYQTVKPTEISYNLDSALPYGEMPNEAIVQKFEETAYLNDCEDVYDNHARDIIKDNSPDVITFESDLPRRNYNSKGFLNVMHNGGRGSENAPAHPEMFLGLTDTDPRGVSTDPDMRKLVEQNEARMRFVRWHADADNSVHQGRPSESEMFHKSRIMTQKAIKPRAKIFRTGKDGRREGLRREYYPHKSFVNKVEEDLTRFRPATSTFTDYITDFALNPQRRTTKLSNKLIRNTRMYHQFTTDHEFKVAKYGESIRNRKLSGQNDSKVGEGDNTDFYNKTAITGEDNINMHGSNEKDTPAKAYKAAGILMGALVNQKKNNTKKDAESTESKDTQANRKTKALEKDLNIILHEIKSENVFDNSALNTKNGKTATPMLAEHLMISQKVQHSDPAHYKLNAEIMYKTVKQSTDFDQIRHEIITDDKKPIRRDEETIFGKQGPTHAKTGVRESKIEVEGKSMNTPTYKVSHKANRGAGVDLFNAEDFAKNSDPTQNRKQNTTIYRKTDKHDLDPDTYRQFSDNNSKERRIGTMTGDKYNMRKYVSNDLVGNMNNNMSETFVMN